jgi:hypothetical protein
VSLTATVGQTLAFGLKTYTAAGVLADVGTGPTAVVTLPDSTTLSDTALNAARTQILEKYGQAYLPDAPRRYQNKVKNAQEAHEAIRPAGDSFRTPEQVAGQAEVLAGMLPAGARGIFRSELERLAHAPSVALSSQSIVALIIGAYAAHRGFKALLAGLSFIHDEENQRGFISFNIMALIVLIASFTYNQKENFFFEVTKDRPRCSKILSGRPIGFEFTSDNDRFCYCNQPIQNPQQWGWDGYLAATVKQDCQTGGCVLPGQPTQPQDASGKL